jgi:hypothetical protein
MSDNMDVALLTLAGEINALETDRIAGNQGKQAAMGYKLAAVRELLRQKNGVSPLHKLPDATGNLPPLGWTRWVADNLSLSQQHAAMCIQHAFAPEKALHTQRQSNAHARHSVAGALRRAVREWPTWSHEQREQFCAGVAKLLEAA